MSSGDEKTRISGDSPRDIKGASPVLPISNSSDKQQPAPPSLHPSFYVISWISLSSAVIVFNKWILDSLGFHYPVILTTYHLSFATLMTQILARTTNLLDGRKSVNMNGRTYLRAIVPIGIFFSLSLICGNLTYLYLSVAFIQMLKAMTPVAVLLSGWALGINKPNLKVFLNVSFIVIGVIIASLGEIKFVTIGVIYQIGGLIFEALRLTMVQRLLNSPDLKMDPLVSLYYFAPICAIMNFVVAAVWEMPKVSMAEIYNVGLFTFFLNGVVAFLLNISVVFLIGKTSAVVLTLCGILKDIMLVFASMIIFGTYVTPLQFFGFSISLCGMIYYKLGYDNMKKYIADGNRKWAEFGARKPVLRKLSVMAMGVLFLVVCFGGLAPTYAPEYDPAQLANQVSSRFGMKS